METRLDRALFLYLYFMSSTRSLGSSAIAHRRLPSWTYGLSPTNALCQACLLQRGIYDAMDPEHYLQSDY